MIITIPDQMAFGQLLLRQSHKLLHSGQGKNLLKVHSDYTIWKLATMLRSREYVSNTITCIHTAMTIHQIRNEISLGTRASGYYRQVFLITDTISEISY